MNIKDIAEITNKTKEEVENMLKEQDVITLDLTER
tara:strand:+ start:4287 stop:4391 length:105 start_codon:yes stop_codon:yes gene_type:complete